MKLEDIKVGMKVRLLSKHGFVDNYDNIEDWYKDCNYWEEVQQIKEQGFGIITDIKEYGDIWVSNTINGNKWCFSISDLEPYEEEFFEESQENKTPKEWLLTPMVTFITRNGHECITLGKGTSYIIETGEVWDNELDENYDNDVNYIGSNDSRFDIMSITYGGNVVWERKEYMTLTDAIKTGKKIKHKDWHNKYYTISELLRLIRLKRNSDLINDFTVAEWEVE